MAVLGAKRDDIAVLVTHRRELFSQCSDNHQHNESYAIWYDSALVRFDIFFQDFMNRIGLKTMAKSKRKFKFKGYININIPKDMNDFAEKFVATEDKVWDGYVAMLRRGYSFKSYFDVGNDCFKVTVTCFDEESSNYGFSMSAYASSPAQALAVAVFKHYEMADGDWTTYQATGERKFG